MLTTLSGKQGLPPALANLSATGILFGYRLNWSFPAVGALDTAYTEIEIATTANGANAAPLGLFAYPTTTHDIQGMQPNLTRYFRGRLIDRIGNIGPWSNWVSATTSADASAVLDILSGKITETQLHQDLQTKIDHIENIDTDISGLKTSVQQAKESAQKANDDLAIERTERIDSINSTTSKINIEIQDRKTAISTLQDGLSQQIKAGDDAVLGVVETVKQSSEQGIAAVQSEITVVSNSLTTTATKLDGVYAQVNPKLIGSTSDLIGSEEGFAGTWSLQSAMIEDDMALSKRIDTTVAQVNDVQAFAQSEVTARVKADEATVQKIDSYIASNDSALSSVRQTAESAVTATSANTQAVQALDSRVTTAEGNANTAKTNAATALTKAETATTQAGSAASLASQASAIANQATNTADTANQNAATALSTANTAANQSSANASQINALTVELGTKASTGALAQTNANVAEINGRVTANTTKIDGVYAQVNPKLIGSTDEFIGSTEGFAGTWTLQSAMIENDMALSQRIDTTVAEISNTKALVQTEAYARAQEDEALSSRINTLKVDVDGNKAAIVTLETARATDNEAFAGRFDTLQASTKTAKDTADEALDKADAATENITTIKLEQGVFTDRLDAIGGEIKTIQGYVDGQQTSIEVVSAVGELNKLKNEIAKARLDEDTTKLQGQAAALTSAVNSYDARIAEITSKRTAEQAKADKNQELIDLYTSQIAELNAAKVDANAQKDAISSQIAKITADKARLNSLVLTESKIKAQHTIKLDSDGVISSYGLAVEESGGTNYSNFVIRANSFALAGPASEGSTPYYPFIFRSTPYTDPNTGTVFPVGAYLKAAFIDYASIKLAQIDTASIGSLSAISANLGTLITYKDPAQPLKARMVMQGSLITVYDDNNIVRVKLGLW